MRQGGAPTARRAGRAITILGGGILLASSACSPASAELQDDDAAGRTPPTGEATLPTGARIANPEPDDGQWIRSGKDYAGSRFSGLTEITAQNVARLTIKGTFSTGVLRGQEAAPLVVDGTMYVTTPYPNLLYALDLTQPGMPTKWTYRPKPLAASQGVACCDVVNRGPAYDDGRLFYNTLDNHTVAVDAATGRELWRTKLDDINIGSTMTMAPLVVKGKVIVGNSGGELGVRGWVAALDASTGRIAWRAYTTGPDADVLIGPRFRPFYASDRGKDLGVTTWPPDMWRTGGGNVWGFITYDPQLDLIYHGTANPGPWNPDLRPGDNKWTSAVFARDPDTGEAVWAYQSTPHDEHDYDGINENILLDIPWQGGTRRVLVRPERNGHMYVIDRASGEVLSAEPFVFVNTSRGVDLKTGRLEVVKEKVPKTHRVVRQMCPAPPGGKDWPPAAFSPRTGLLYVPTNNLCFDAEATEVSYIAGTPYVGMNVKMYPGPGGHRGEFIAWDPVRARKVWGIRESFPVWSSAVVTAGDVVFYGTMDGWFKALDARTGAVLWQQKLSSGIVGQPVTYRGPDGRQYVAILAGVGGWAGSIVSANLDPRDSTAASGFANAMKDLKQATTKGGTLYVFGLP